MESEEYEEAYRLEMERLLRKDAEEKAREDFKELKRARKNALAHAKAVVNAIQKEAVSEAIEREKIQLLNPPAGGQL